MLPTPLAAALCAVAGYLLGSFSGAITASRLFHKTDIRKYGSGNAGMTNALRTFGAKTAVFVTLLDALKTAAALALGAALLGSLTAALPFAGTGVLLGHAFPLWYRFKGGKCVLSGAVLLLAMDWRVFGVGAAAFLIVAFVTKIVAAGSLSACIVAAVAVPLLRPDDPALAIFTGCMAAFIIALHHSNIRRMLQKRELPIHPGHPAEAESADHKEAR
jgi:glycerol-3-phosphate acyltransferase PlsY